jgi:hypothetical protein
MVRYDRNGVLNQSVEKVFWFIDEDKNQALWRPQVQEVMVTYGDSLHTRQEEI